MYSVKTIEMRLGIDRDKAKEIRGLLSGTINPMSYRSAKKWFHECYSSPSKIELIHEAINEVLGGYGIEAIRDNQWSSYHCDIGLVYVNMGDTYTPTVCYDTRKDKWFLSSWGDVVEAYPSRFE